MLLNTLGFKNLTKGKAISLPNKFESLFAWEIMINPLDGDYYNLTQNYAAKINGLENIPVGYRLYIRSGHYFDDLFLNKFKIWIEEYKNKFSTPGIMEGYSILRGHSVDFDSVKRVDFNYFVYDNVFYLDYFGAWKDTILHEVPLLSAISKIYYEIYNPQAIYGYDNLVNDCWRDLKVPIIEMGTRRRISRDHQKIALFELAKMGKLRGTSNVHLAKGTTYPLFGSVSHQWYMALGNKKALELWLKCGFPVNIALPDTFTTDEFLKVFNVDLARKYDGIRHDSGDPHVFTEKFLKHYTDFGINPKDKTLIYSDGLDCNRVNELYDAYKDKIKVEFGVGSNLSCIMDNPLKIVIKMHMFDGKDVKKISDDPRKAT